MATEDRDLRTGRTVWQDRPVPRVPMSVPRKDFDTDVLVVGAGTSGALVAEALADAGMSVTVVDRRGPALGSTSACTALIEYEVDTPLSMLAEQIGVADAERAWRRSFLCVQGLAARTRALGIPCDLTRRDNIYLAGDMLDRAGLEREAQARRAAGIETGFLTRGELKARFGISRDGALVSYDDLECNPPLITAGYLRAAVERGARVCAPVEITEVAASRSGVVARTAHGPEIRCRHLVFATGYELPEGVPGRGHRVASTFAIATVPQPENLWAGQSFIWEASDPYLYIRTTPEGRVVCGGEDEEFEDEARRDAMLGEKTQRIAQKLGRLMPSLTTEVEFAWAGSFGLTETGLPIVDEVPKMPGCWAVLGYGGNGVTYSRLGADIIRNALTGKDDRDRDLYTFARVGAAR